MSNITVVASHFRTEEWARMMVDSVRKNSSEEHEIIITDNSGDLNPIEGVKILHPEGNLGHGGGLDHAIHNATTRYVLALDIDAHILSKGWEDALLNEINAEPKTVIVGAKGDCLKPYRPCVSFVDRDYFMANKHSYENVPVEWKGQHMVIDVGVFMALRTLHDEYKIRGIEVGESVYHDVWGDTYWLAGKPMFYHNWYSSRFTTGDNEIDGRKKEDFLKAKESIFRQYAERNA